jgi:hypothetical protein
MQLSPEHRARLLVGTREQAAALLEDIHYLRGISTGNQSAPEIRRGSSVLRRLLVDRDIPKVANPRLGRFSFRAPDNKPFYRAANDIPFTFFGSGDTEIFGVKVRHTIVDLKVPAARRRYLGMIAPSSVLMKLDGFVSQRVLCLNGHWVTRGEVIEYIANKASGVHSDTPATPSEKTISRIRRCVWYTKSENSVSVTCDMASLELRADPVFLYSPEAIDPALLELLATISQILRSEDTMRLEILIKQEIT